MLKDKNRRKDFLIADVIITPASGLIDFQNTSGISSATIQLDGNGNLKNLSAAGGIYKLAILPLTFLLVME